MSKVDEAREILRAFDFDRKRTNETAARTLLALAEVDEQTSWAEATNHRMGVRAILDWMRGPLGHPIAENSRETIRRFVLHQFVDAGFCLYNEPFSPGKPPDWRGSARWCGRDWAGVGVVRAGAARDSVF